VAIQHMTINIISLVVIYSGI